MAITYTPTEWSVGKEITLEDMNKIENQLGVLTPRVESISNDYSSSASYIAGDYCFYNNILYRCTQDNTNGEHVPNTSPSYWTPVNVMSEVATGGVGDDIATSFSSSSSTQYTIGQYVVYAHDLYRCIGNTTGDTWDSTKWEKVQLANEVDDLIVVSETQPSTTGTKLWVKSPASSAAADSRSIEVPTYEEFKGVKDSIAAEYSTSVTYNIGDYCYHDNTLYQCVTTVSSAEAWNASHWVETTVGEEIVGVNESLNNLQNNKVVRFDSAQSLTAVQKDQARDNIEAASEEDVTSLKSVFLNNEISNNAFDVLLPIQKSTGTNNGVTYTWNSDGTVCTLDTNGAATSAISENVIYSNHNGFPVGMEAGKTIRVMPLETTQNVFLQIYISMDGSTYPKTPQVSTNLYTEYVLPSNATGVRIRIGVSADTTLNNMQIAPQILTESKSNSELGAELIDRYNQQGFDEYLINGGEYTINAADLESGQWSYSRKAANAKRARTKNLLPVRAGMVITYANTTFDTYFGVLETPTSNAYIQTPGWKTDGNGTVKITKDGWLTFIIRNHSDNNAAVDPADYDSTVTIKTTNQTEIDNLYKCNSSDLLYGITTKQSNPNMNGVAYTWNNDKCTVHGDSNSSGSINSLIDISNIPAIIVPGETYYVLFNQTSDGVKLRIIYYDSQGNSLNKTEYFTKSSFVTIPSGAVKWSIQLYVYPNTTVDSVVTDVTILSTMSNKELENAVINLDPTKLSLNRMTPTYTGADFNWSYGKYINAPGGAGITDIQWSALTDNVPVNPGDIIINTTPDNDVGENIPCFIYVAAFSGDTYLERVRISDSYSHIYVVPDTATHIRFCYGHTSTYGIKATSDITGMYFRMQIVSKAKKEHTLIDPELPLYVAIGASTTEGAVHHFNNAPYTDTQYDYPRYIGDALGLRTINRAIGGTGWVYRSSYNLDNFMDVIFKASGRNLANDNYDADADILSKTSLVTIMTGGSGNDSTMGLPIGSYDDYYPYDESGYHPAGVNGQTEMKNKGATRMGCINWAIKWISDHYPKAQIVLISCLVSGNNNRVITKGTNPNPEGVGSPKYKLTFTDPFPSGSETATFLTEVKTLTKKLNIPLIDMYEDGLPWCYWGTEAKNTDGTYALFSTTGDSSDQSTWVKNNHPNDTGYLMLARYIAGRVSAVFYR